MSGTWADAGLRVVWTDFPEVIPDPIGDALRADAVAYWKMDEVSGTRMDATGNGNHIDSISGATSATGKLENGLSISDASYYARYNGVGLSFADTNYSIALWLKVRAFGVGQANCVFTYYNSGDSSVEYGLETDDFGFPGMAFYTQFGFVDSSALGGLSTDTWYFVVVEQDADLSKVRLRINELAVQETGFGSPNVGVGNRLSFGSDGTLQGLDCITDEVLVINRLLTSDERAYLYNSGNGRTLYP